jgi:general secretion pathway protein I
MMAVIILASGLLLLTNSWGSSFLRVRKTQQQFEVAALIERKMTELELEYRGKPLDSIPEEKAEDFGDQYPQYSWKMTSKKLEFPDMTSVLTSKDGGADQMTISMIKQLSEGLSKAIKEVTLTIVYKPLQGKPLQYSVTTYFVDYDQSLAFGVPGGI